MHFALCKPLLLQRIPKQTRLPARQALLIMKLTAILLFTACLQVSAKGFGQIITLSEKNAPLEKLFGEIKKQTGYTFAYTESLLSQAKTVSIDIKNGTLEQVLTICFKDQPFTYAIIEKTIVVKPQNISDQTVNTSSSIDIKGRVTDKDGNPVVGANIKIKGVSQGTTTNENGEFVLKNVDDNAVLEISFVGYETQLIPVKNRTSIAVLLFVAIQKLNEVIVQKGYYSTSQKLNTGNVSKVTDEIIEKQPVSNILQTLQARVPGLYIQQLNGVPGSNFKVTIRGRNSIANGNDPLYIVDGVPFISNGLSSTTTSANILGTSGISPLNSINPQDIESIEVLKDADATAIYGSRGANGVILITTKKGDSKRGKPKVNINISTGSSKITRTIKLLNTPEYISMRQEAFRNDNVTPAINNAPDLVAWDQNRFTDWQKVLIGGNALYRNVHASVAGGNSSTQFLFSGGYETQGTVYPGDLNADKISSMLSLTNMSDDKKFKASFSLNYVANRSKLTGTDFTNYALRLAPNAPALYTPDGKLNWENSTWTNPLSELEVKFRANTSNLISNATLSYKILNQLEIKANLGFNDIRNKERKLTPSTYYDPVYAATPIYAESYLNNTGFKSWILEPQLQWDGHAAKGKISALAGLTFQEQLYDQLTLYGTGFSSNALIENIQSASTKQVLADNNSDYKYNAIFGRINYNYKEKYILNATIRRDGSSRFGPGKQFGNFGSVGAAWIFSEEPFLKNERSPLSFGKLRASYGSSGNDQIGDYRFLDSYQASGAPYQGIVGLTPVRLFNPDFAWEVNKKFETGLALGFINDRINLNIDYYQNRSSNQLVNYPLAMTTGFTGILANLDATVQNTGWEFEINTLNWKNNQFKWTTAFNLSIPKNKLISFPGLSGSSYANQYVVGEPLTISKRYKYSGVDPQTGIYSFADLNGDGLISSDDKILIKNVAQKFYGGLSNDITYKSFQLEFLLQFVNQTGNNFWGATQLTPGLLFNQPEKLLQNGWQKPGDAGKTAQRFTTNVNSAAVTAFFSRYTLSDATIVNASFIRLKNISLSYDLSTLIKKFSGRVYLQCQNLLTITHYFGLDPEYNYASALPPLRTFVIGTQLSF
jgi:TonB-linked SusC/RagA family outer membrane protein